MTDTFDNATVDEVLAGTNFSGPARTARGVLLLQLWELRRYTQSLQVEVERHQNKMDDLIYQIKDQGTLQQSIIDTVTKLDAE